MVSDDSSLSIDDSSKKISQKLSSLASGKANKIHFNDEVQKAIEQVIKLVIFIGEISTKKIKNFRCSEPMPWTVKISIRPIT